VTVLFADLRSFTSLAEPLDPEDTHALMERYFDLILERVHRFEGTVNQFLGDGVMALFGAPLALEGAPRRAVQAALGIQQSLDALRRELRAARDVELGTRIGIHTGLVVVGRIGDDLRMDYTAIGDTTNLAARLQQLARPGSVLISEATRRLVQGFFELRDIGEVEVKGRSRPVHAFEVIGERPVGGRIEAVADAGLTPLVGRERELDLLRATFDTARQGRGQVAFIVGEAGIGKSRLLYELRRRLADRPHYWLEGRCASYARTSAYHAVSDALRRAFNIEDRDDDATALAKIENVEESLGGELAWTLPFMRLLLSLPVGDAAVSEMDAVTRRSETFRALQARFLRLSREQPFVLVIEDLHWIDGASEEFLGFLAESIPAVPALLVFTHRPGYRHPFGDRSYHVRVTLQGLSDGDMTSMVGSLLESSTLPEALRRLIAEKAEGNPFFVEELTRSLLEEGVLGRRNGGVELLREVSALSVPDSIQGVLMARIDRLEEQPKRAIQVASVIGREFALRLLERIREAGEGIRTVIDELRGLELIYEKTAHPELAFMFKHALTHDVAYESILLQRRRALHRIVGSAIEELYRDRLAEHYEALASHFTLAEDWERAFLYHERAAEKAAAAYANHSAVEHCRRALEIAERLGARVSDERRRDLEERLGEACFCVSEMRASGEAYLRAAELCTDGADRAADLARASWSFLAGHHYEETRDTASRALSLGNAHGATLAQSLALSTQLWHATTTHGPLAQAGLLEEARRVSERSGDPEALVRTLLQEALAAEWCGDYRGAISLSERGAAIARSGHTHDSIWCLWILGISAGCLGEYGRALAVLGQSLDLCERIGDRARKARVLNTLGWVFGELGSHSRASAYNEAATALGRELVERGLVAAAPEIHANAAINLAGNRLALGDPQGALALLGPIADDLDRPGDPWQRWRYSMHLWNAQARVELARGEPERVLPLVDRELEAARHHRSPKIEARALELRGRALLAMDRRGEAEQALHAALQCATRIEYPPVTWRSLSLLAELARRAGSRSAAEDHAARARTLVESLARSLSEADLRRELGALGDRLAADPLQAYR
jgi:class 3 adenylate cyclase/tetratricopeptide (TPR) repeat protein